MPTEINISARRLRHILAEKASKNNFKSAEDENISSRFVRKKFFRHQKKHSIHEHQEEKRGFEIPEHEFEERFEPKPPPKVNNTEPLKNTEQFKGWFFLDSSKDLEAAESRHANYSEVSGVG